jgi:uncharacterized cupin superfamily protein
MDTYNVFSDESWDRENDHDGYRHKATVIGNRLGASLLGGSLYELAPGEATWPYHYELGCEEWLIVVSGRPTLRSPDGEQQLEPGDLTVFPEGPVGAHKIVNRSTEPVRLLIMSSKAPLAVVHYPDSGKLGIWTQQGGYEAMLPAAPTIDYWEGEA